MNKCSMSKTRTHLTSLSGFPTTLNHQFVIFLQRDLRWQLLSLVTQQPFKKCSRELLNNSQLCSEEKPSYIGTLVKVWTRWNSQKLNPTWTTLFLNINNTKMPPLKKKTNTMKKKEKLLNSDCDYISWNNFNFNFFNRNIFVIL